MDRSNIVFLVGQTYATDSIGQQVATETKTQIFASINSISRDEYFTASSQGLKPQYQVRINRYEYDGQKEIEINGERYAVYRSYVGKGEMLDLYVEAKKGVK